jgi:hypothetical protein
MSAPTGFRAPFLYESSIHATQDAPDWMPQGGVGEPSPSFRGEPA